MSKIDLGVRPEKKRIVTSFEIGDLKEPWEAYCQRNNITSGEALCEVIAKLTAADRAAIPPFNKRRAAPELVTKPPKPLEQSDRQEGRARSRLQLRLKPTERTAIDERAKADGFQDSTKWVVALIRARLTDQPQFGASEIDRLAESNKELLAIGRNLNQIAHALNASRGKSTLAYDAELVENLAGAVKRHVKRVGDALRASIHRWSLS